MELPTTLGSVGMTLWMVHPKCIPLHLHRAPGRVRASRWSVPLQSGTSTDMWTGHDT